MLEKINESTWELTLGDEVFTIFLSLGLKDELFSLVSKLYSKYLVKHPEHLLVPDEVKEKLYDYTKRFEEAETEDEKKEAYDRLVSLRNEVVDIMTIKMKERSLDVVNTMLKAIEEFKYEVWALLLTTRDLEGRVVKRMTVNKLKNSPLFGSKEAEDDLETLLQWVIDIVEERLKKSLQVKEALETKLKDLEKMEMI